MIGRNRGRLAPPAGRPRQRRRVSLGARGSRASASIRDESSVLWVTTATVLWYGFRTVISLGKYTYWPGLDASARSRPYRPPGWIALTAPWYYVYGNRVYSEQIADSSVSPFASFVCAGGAGPVAATLRHTLREGSGGLLPGPPSPSLGRQTRLGLRRGCLFSPGRNGVPGLRSSYGLPRSPDPGRG